jgi:hypothetical protein
VTWKFKEKAAGWTYETRGRIDLEVKVYVQVVSLYRARQGILPWFPSFVTSPRATDLALTA